MKRDYSENKKGNIRISGIIRSSGLLVIPLVVFLILYALPVFAATVSLQTGATQGKGVEFDVDVVIDSVNDLYGIATDITYDTEFLDVVDEDGNPGNGIQPKVTEGTFLNNNGADATLLESDLQDDTAGTLVVGLTRSGIVTGVDAAGNTTLLSPRFKAKKVGTTTLRFVKSGLKDSTNTDIAVTAWNEVSLTISNPPDISLSCTATAFGPLDVNGTLLHTCTVSNAGDADLNIASIAVTGGDAAMFTVTAATCPDLSPDLAQGNSCTFTISFSPSSAGAKTTTLSIVSNDPDENPLDTVLTGTGIAADISVAKTVSNPSVNVGTNVVFTVTVTNNGPDNATGVKVTDLLPAGLGYVSNTVAVGTYTSGTGVWDIGALANGAAVTMTVTAAVNQAGNNNNTAARTASAPVDLTAANDSATATVKGLAADLSVTKVNNADPVEAGQQIQYTITVSNAGPSDASSVNLTDTMPSDIQSPEYSTDGGTNWIAWTGSLNLGTVNSGNSQQVLIRGTISSAASGTITNTANVTSTVTDPNTANNTDSETTTIGGFEISCADSGIPCVERVGGGSDADNLVGGKPKVDVEYQFSVTVKDSVGTPQYVKLFLTQRNNPGSGDFAIIPMECPATGSFSSGKTCTYTTKLGAAFVHKFYIEAKSSTGAIVKTLPTTGFSTGPAVQLLEGFGLVGIPRNINAANLNANIAFGSVNTLRWDAATNLYSLVTNAEPAKAGEGYFTNRVNATLPQNASFGNIQAAEYTYQLQAGWNIISTPYVGNVKLSDIKVKKGSDAPITWTQAVGTPNEWVVNALYTYNGKDWGRTYSFETAEEDAVLVPWMGYWIYLNKSDDTYSLVIPKP
jgi:uncharacterized repeat protein (TIGR01451 family)